MYAYLLFLPVPVLSSISATFLSRLLDVCLFSSYYQQVLCVPKCPKSFLCVPETPMFFPILRIDIFYFPWNFPAVNILCLWYSQHPHLEIQVFSLYERKLPSIQCHIGWLILQFSILIFVSWAMLRHSFQWFNLGALYR